MTLHGRVRLDRPQRLRLILLFLGLASGMADKEGRFFEQLGVSDRVVFIRYVLLSN